MGKRKWTWFDKIFMSKKNRDSEDRYDEVVEAAANKIQELRDCNSELMLEIESVRSHNAIFTQDSDQLNHENSVLRTDLEEAKHRENRHREEHDVLKSHCRELNREKTALEDRANTLQDAEYTSRMYVLKLLKLAEEAKRDCIDEKSITIETAQDDHKKVEDDDLELLEEDLEGDNLEDDILGEEEFGDNPSDSCSPTDLSSCSFSIDYEGTEKRLREIRELNDVLAGRLSADDMIEGRLDMEDSSEYSEDSEVTEDSSSEDSEITEDSSEDSEVTEDERMRGANGKLVGRYDQTMVEDRSPWGID